MLMALKYKLFTQNWTKYVISLFVNAKNQIAQKQKKYVINLSATMEYLVTLINLKRL